MAKETYIQRSIEPVLLRVVRDFPAVMLTGPRQSGKSTLLLRAFGSSHRLISFDDPVIRERALSDPTLLLESAGPRIILDEVQYVPEILSHVKMLIDKDRTKRGRFILTGSSQFTLMRHLSETLAGRLGLLVLLPFSRVEQQQIPGVSRKLRTSQDHFIYACLRGSFPEVNVRSSMDATRWYGSYAATFLERDIRMLYDIGSLREFQRFMQLLASRCSQILNLSGLANDLGVAVNTVKRWISVLEANHMIYLLPPYYRNLGKRITKSPKVYFLDCGLVCYLVGIRDKEQLLRGPMAGALFENYVVQETVKAFCNRGLRGDLFYVKTHNGLEMDLMVQIGTSLYPFEIKLSRTVNVGMATPIERFMTLFAKLRSEPAKIISLYDEEMRLTKTVSVQSVSAYIDWLGRE